MRREWIEITCSSTKHGTFAVSPSMRREWIEILLAHTLVYRPVVSLHAEGVD